MSKYSGLPRSIPWDLIERSLATAGSHDTQAQLDAWCSADSTNAQFVAAVRDALAQAHPDAGVPAASAILAAVEQRVVEEQERRGALRRAGGLSGNRRLGGGILRQKIAYLVSSLAVASGVAVLMFDWGTLNEGHAGPSVHTYTTARGERMTVTLSPGTQAVLGPATTLTVTLSHVAKRVNVTLTGQALFTVRHMAQNAFAVTTGSTVTRVLGTTFLIRHYARDTGTRIVVRDGRLAVRTPQTDAILAAGTRGIVNDSGQVLVTSHSGVDDELAWARGQLVFRETPVSDVMLELGRTYNADIRMADSSLIKERLTLTVPTATWSLDDALSAIMLTLDAHYTARETRAGRVITIAPGRVSARVPKPSFSVEPQYGR